MSLHTHPKIALFHAKPTHKIPFDRERFPEVDCVVPLIGNSYKASEGIRDGDLAMISFDREPVPGDLVIADTPHDGRRLMRLVAGKHPFLRSDNPSVRDVRLDEEGACIIGRLVDTMRNPAIMEPI